MTATKFAVAGGQPAFDTQIPVGQLYFPNWERYEAAVKGIFKRRYYTNQGPLVQELEVQLQQMLGVKHVICVVNATVGLMMAAEALELRGKVILPSFTFLASAQSLSWAGLEPVFCDVNPVTHQIDVAKIKPLITESVSAIMAVNLWGGASDVEALRKLADEAGKKLYFDSAHAFGCEINGKRIGCFGELEVMSFHATKMLSATEGGCICTNDDAIAAKLRNIRSSYGAGAPATVVKTSNGRMSEFQAAIALLNLEDFEGNRTNNENTFLKYQQHLAGIPGVRLIRPSGVSRSNYQYIVCEINSDQFGLSRQQLLDVLKAENINARRYFFPGVHKSIEFSSLYNQQNNPLPITESLCETCLQLPVGALLDINDVEVICDLIRNAQRHSADLRNYLGSVSI
ncbi:DegT/DnrJ/EryC1/StrS family aminotransferase [Shewanella baltica]|uniref:DegT/DnrJ/EryC1/StrS family aminotransferase n=1 Tax=Shewanella baltica TaxID=62322 RepID=UPI003D7BBD4B